MPYTEGAHDSPADTLDRLVRIGTKYQAAPPAVADGDNVYLLVDSAGRIFIVGSAAHDAADSGNPLKIGGKATTGTPGAVTDADRVDAHFDEYGKQGVFVGGDGGTIMARVNPGDSDATNAAPWSGLEVNSLLHGVAPDAAIDRARFAGDSAPGLGALNVALIGGDVTLRASAVAGEASGTSTAVDNLGWVKGFNCHLDVTAAPAGGSPTLDVYLQTQLASGAWQDIAHFTQATGVTAEIVDWGPADGNFSGIGAEGAAVTYDRFFAEQDGALGAATVRIMNLGDSMRVKWVFVAGGSSGDFTFAVTTSPHS